MLGAPCLGVLAATQPHSCTQLSSYGGLQFAENLLQQNEIMRLPRLVTCFIRTSIRKLRWVDGQVEATETESERQTRARTHTEIETETETERERERERQRERERDRDTETQRQRDRETERQRHRERERKRASELPEAVYRSS